MRVVDIVVPFAPRGPVPGKIRFIEPQGVNGHRRPVRIPLATVHHGSAKKGSGTGPYGDCRRVLWGTGPAGSVFGEN